MMSQSEFIVVVLILRVQPESHQRQALPSTFAHDKEAQLLQVGSQIISRACQIRHNAPIAFLAEADHLVVLPDDLRCAFREVEGE